MSMRPSILCSCPRDVDGNVRERDPYCNVHGRIRDMDAGASPFVDIAAVADQEMRKKGLSEEEIDRLNRENPSERSELGKRLAREASEADARSDDPLGDAVRAFEDSIPKGCKCTWRSSMPSSPYEISRHCPIHYPLSKRLRDEFLIMEGRHWIVPAGHRDAAEGTRLSGPGVFVKSIIAPNDYRVQVMRETQTGYVGDSR